MNIRPLMSLVAGFGLTAIAGAGPADHCLDIYWNDVEGGGGTLIVTPTGESILIDSGNPGGRDAGRISQTAQSVAGLKKIDYYVTTHFHLDHFGGAAELASHLPVGQVYDNDLSGPNPDHKAGEAAWLATTLPYRSFKADRRNVTAAGLILPLRQSPHAAPLRLHCVACRQAFVPAPAGTKPNPRAGENAHKNLAPTDNDNSSAWVLDFGTFRFFDGGDLTWNLEGLLVTPLNRVGEVDVYQVDHHGLNASNNPVLIHSLAPTVAVMNNGILKGTAKSTMNGLHSSPGIQAIYQLHKNLRPGDPEDNTGDDYIANFASDPNHAPAHYIKLSVDPTGNSYTITLSGSGRSRTYQTRGQKAPGG